MCDEFAKKIRVHPTSTLFVLVAGVLPASAMSESPPSDPSDSTASEPGDPEKARRNYRVGLNYKCRRCGQLKKGHVCTAPDNSERGTESVCDDDDLEQSLMADEISGEWLQALFEEPDDAADTKTGTTALGKRPAPTQDSAGSLEPSQRDTNAFAAFAPTRLGLKTFLATFINISAVDISQAGPLRRMSRKINRRASLSK